MFEFFLNVCIYLFVLVVSMRLFYSLSIKKKEAAEASKAALASVTEKGKICKQVIHVHKLHVI